MGASGLFLEQSRRAVRRGRSILSGGDNHVFNKRELEETMNEWNGAKVGRRSTSLIPMSAHQERHQVLGALRIATGDSLLLL